MTRRIETKAFDPADASAPFVDPVVVTVAHYGDADPSRLFIFFDGACAHAGGGPFPFAFTTGCLAIDRPE